MKLQTMVTVALLAIVTVVVTAATGGGMSGKLPLPQAAMRAHGSTGSRAGPAAAPGGPAASQSLPSGAVPPGSSSSASTNQLYTIPTPPVLTGCTVSVSDPAPPRGQTAETATVRTTAGADIRLEADYVRTRSVHSGIADGWGHAYFPLTISHAEAGFTVDVTATVSLRGAKDTCSTSFTPVYPAAAPPATGGGQ
jgi:hypothetical protein